MTKHECLICGKEMADGITIWPWPRENPTGYVHPECAQGRPIDHGD